MYVQNYSNNSIQANKTPVFCLLLTEKKQKTKGKIEQRRGKTKEHTHSNSHSLNIPKFLLVAPAAVQYLHS